MGNKPSSQSKNEPLPQLVLYLETLMLWSGHSIDRPTVQDVEKPAPAERRSSSSSLHIEGETLFAQVWLDGCEVEDGRVDSFPSQPIVIHPSSLDSELRIKFYLGTPPRNWNTGMPLSADLAPWSTISATLSKLYMFGAPLYSSTWLGLVKHEPHFGQDLTTSYFDAVLRAHLPDADIPKVKITVFKPSSLDLMNKAHAKDPRSWQPKHDVLLPFGGAETGFECVEGGDSASTKASAAQLQGLIKCVDQSNMIITKLQEATKGFNACKNSVSDHRMIINRLDREIKSIKYRSAEAEEHWNAHGVEAQYANLRREISDVSDKHHEEVKLTTARHMESLRAEHVEIQRIKDVAQQRASDLTKDHDNKMQQYTKSVGNAVKKVEQEITAARGQWERSAHEELTEVTNRGMFNLEQVQSVGHARLQSQRRDCETESETLRRDVRELLMKLNQLRETKENVETEFRDASQELNAVRSAQGASSEAATETIQREINSFQSETQEAEARRSTEIEKLRRELLDLQQKRLELLEEAEQDRVEDIASISNANKRDWQEEIRVADSKIEELSQEQEQALEMERETWQNKCFSHEKTLVELRASADMQREDNLDKVDSLEALEKEESILAGEVHELKREHENQEAAIAHTTEELSTRLKVAQDEAARKMLEFENAICDLRREEAYEWERSNSERALELSQRQEEMMNLRKELEERREEASKQCFDMIKSWEQRCEQSSHAASTAEVSCQHAEDAAAQALISRKLEIHVQLEAAEAMRVTELQDMESELTALSKSTQDETARLTRKLETLREDLAKRLSDIAEEGNRNLESRRQALEQEHASRVSDLTRELERTQTEKDSTIANQKRDHEISLVPLQAELEALRSTASHLPEASRENRSLKHDLANERALLDLASSAHSDAEAMLASRSQQILKLQAETSSMQADLAQTQKRLDEEQAQLDHATQAYGTNLANVRQERERALSVKEQKISDLQNSLDEQQSDFDETRSARLGDIHRRFSEEKNRLEGTLSLLQIEIEEDRLATQQTLAQLSEKLTGDLEVEFFYKQKIIEEIQQAQQAFDELRLEIEEAERVDQREQSSAIATLQEQGRLELMNLMNTSRAEIQSMAVIQQTAFAKLQAAHEAERQRFQELLSDQEAKIDVLRQQHLTADEEVEEMSEKIVLLQKEINSSHEQHARDMQAAIVSQDSTLANTRRMSADRAAQLQSAGEAEEQALLKQLRAVELEVETTRNNIKSLRLEGERQKAKADRAVEQTSQDMKRLKEKVESTSASILAERARNADTRVRQDQEAIASKESYESKRMSYQMEQERLERKFEALQQELAVMQERLKGALADMEGQEKQCDLKLQMEVEDQERVFQKQRRAQDTQHQSDCDAQDSEQTRVRNKQRSTQQSELDKLQTHMAELSAQLRKMKEAPAKIEEAKIELRQMEDQCATLQESMRAAAKLQVERREAEIGRLEAQHASELENARTEFSKMLSKSRQDADDVRMELESQLHQKREEFNQKKVDMLASIDNLKASQAKAQADFERQLGKDIKELRMEHNTRNDKLREEIQAASIEHDLQNAARTGREAEFRESLEEQLNAARSAAEEKVNATYNKEKEAATAEFDGARATLVEQVKKAQAASNVLKETLEKSLTEFSVRLEKEIAEEKDKAVSERTKNGLKQKELEERLNLAQVHLAQQQQNIEDKTKMHEMTLQEKSRNEEEELEKAREDLHSRQAGTISELTAAQKKAQDSLRRMQDECFGTIDSVRQQALLQSEKRARDATAKFRKDLWNAQQNYNTWQRRLDKVLREFDHVGCGESVFEKPVNHPCEFLYTRLLLRMFRALVEEKHSVWNEEELKRLFDTLPIAEDGGKVAELSKQAFRDAVHKSLCFHRSFDLTKFVRSLEHSSVGSITADDFETRLQANLALDRGTIVQIYKFADAAANVAAANAGGVKPQPGLLLEEELTSLLDHPQVRKVWEPEECFDFTRSRQPPTLGRVNSSESTLSDEKTMAHRMAQRFSKEMQSQSRSFQRLGGARRASEILSSSATSPVLSRISSEIKEKEKVLLSSATDSALRDTQPPVRMNVVADDDGGARWV